MYIIIMVKNLSLNGKHTYLHECFYFTKFYNGLVVWFLFKHLIKLHLSMMSIIKNKSVLNNTFALV